MKGILLFSLASLTLLASVWGRLTVHEVTSHEDLPEGWQVDFGEVPHQEGKREVTVRVVWPEEKRANRSQVGARLLLFTEETWLGECDVSWRETKEGYACSFRLAPKVLAQSKLRIPFFSIRPGVEFQVGRGRVYEFHLGALAAAPGSSALKSAAATHQPVTLVESVEPVPEETPKWSPVVNGVRGRLAFEGSDDGPFLKVFVELENVADSATVKGLRYTVDSLEGHVVGADGSVVERARRPYDGTAPAEIPLNLPYHSRLRFQVSFPGLAFFPEREETIVDVGGGQAWVLPSAAGPFSMSAKLHFTSGKSEEGNGLVEEWTGSLSLPPVRLPTAERRTKSGEKDDLTGGR